MLNKENLNFLIRRAIERKTLRSSVMSKLVSHAIEHREKKELTTVTNVMSSIIHLLCEVCIQNVGKYGLTHIIVT